MKKEKILISVVCFVLTLAITLQLRTMAEADSVVTKSFANDDLKETLLSWEEKYESIAKDLEKSNNELAKVRTSTTENDNTSKEKSEQIKKNNMLLGLTDVVGDGIIITLKDGQVNVATDNISQYLVHDANLRGIVSELANAGVEAISINDQRIVNTTSINCAGNVISINGQKVSSPFIIKAIGNPEMLYGINRPGGYKTYMEQNSYTSFETKKTNNISIKKFNGAISSKYLIKK